MLIRRWVSLGNVLALRLVSHKVITQTVCSSFLVSLQVMIRFPTYEHLRESGLATQQELLLLNQMETLVQGRHQVN